MENFNIEKTETIDNKTKKIVLQGQIVEHRRINKFIIARYQENKNGTITVLKNKLEILN